TIYKWQDANGVWNFSDLPPLDRPYALVIGTPNVTSVPTVVPESAEPSSASKSVAP
ncbi:MAG: transglycosylase, partial [Lysobacterales bacterium CG02_land_8_20_14_3_00_62_12]